MRLFFRLVVWLLGLVVVGIAGLAVYLVVAPPDLLRVATGYSAKIVCSNVFIAGRDPDQVMAVDVQAPGHPLLKFVRVSTDVSDGSVTAKLLGLFAPSVAIHRSGLGCASVPDGDVAKARAVQLASAPVPAAPSDVAWPMGDRVEVTRQADLDPIIADPEMAGPDMRAIVVVKGGVIAGEGYGEGFSAETPLLGWSMTKTVNAALIGRLVLAGKIGLDDAGLRPEWTDARKDIRLRDLLGMESGLGFNEDYGDVSDVNRMLFLERDMAGFTAGQAQVAPVDTAFNYSSGTATLLSRIWMDRIGDEAAALAFPRTALFEPLGMSSAEMEADASGTLVGSSYMYASARDWAKFGLFLLRDGVWNGTAMLPPGWVKAMDTSNGLPGDYSEMQSWLTGPHESEGGGDVGLPADTFWLQGHDGQTIAVIPSEDLVVVRLGLTPWKLNYWPEKLVKAVVDTLH